MIVRFFVAMTCAAVASTAAAFAGTLSIEPGTLSGVRDLGPAPASVRVHVAVVLTGHHGAELARLVAMQADIRSPLYHHFLSPQQLRNYFAPTIAENTHVIAALQRGGFTITNTFPNRSVVDASAPAPIAARYFTTDIHRVLSPDAGLTYTNVRPGVIPGDLARLVGGVFGLDGAHRFHARPVPLPAGVARPIRPAVRPDGSPLYGPDGGYGPQIFTAAYDLPATNGHTGTGRASGVEMDGDFLDTDLAGYLAYFGVTRTGPSTTRIAVDGGAPAFPGGDATETTLDVETLVSLAPGTALYVYEIPALNDKPLIDVFNRVVSDNLVDSLNSSWGGWERQGHGRLAKELNAIEEQGSAEGITFHSISGDWGIHCFGSAQIGVCLPGSTPYSIAVGGTTLLVNQDTGKETNEVVWNDPGFAEGTGAGVSVVFQRPSYQNGVPNVISSGRNVPDIAFDGDPLTGESLRFNGRWDGPNGGTSLSSPIFGAALAEINQLQNSRSGYLNPALYSAWLAKGYGHGSKLYFRDIIEGNVPPYYAQPGYDQVSGIGAMQVNNFAGLLQPK
jgi:subtilase family serine protease